ncbi:NYN domain-containing protein [Blautia sp. MSJ-36]|uniref:NYN domain-containing protein n=1 Tax=Blautia sp. MSJ-36 TaxID=2841530 RepID=UPI001C123845|nr:NYN domain-containing protein [Blautia sp. MSJ-36]MBU5448795.1 NYN domain-containing protein [Blautia sp. MSJ-36]
MYIFWDNSNIHYAGLNQVRPMLEPTAKKELYRTYFSNLLKLVVQEREVENIYFAGSVPPKGDALWNQIRKLGITPSLLPRSISDGEADTTDHVLQLALLRLYMDSPEPKTVALLTGDGAGINDGEGFLADARRLAQKGWKFEVYSWDATCHKLLKEFAKNNGKYVELEKYYKNITFIKDTRMAEPL